MGRVFVLRVAPPSSVKRRALEVDASALLIMSGVGSIVIPLSSYCSTLKAQLDSLCTFVISGPLVHGGGPITGTSELHLARPESLLIHSERRSEGAGRHAIMKCSGAKH